MIDSKINSCQTPRFVGARYQPVMRHLLIPALLAWLGSSFPDPLEQLPPTWDDEIVLRFVRTRLVRCPRCGAKPGYRCRGLNALAGQFMRLHHLPRGLEAQRIFGITGSYKLPSIPYLIVVASPLDDDPLPETQKRAEAQR